MTTRTYNSRLKKLKEDSLYQPEMDRFTDEYVEYVKEIAFSMPAAPTMMVEKRLDYSAYAPEGFGTGDCVMLQGTELHIVDFKYGKGVPVKAEGNPQLALYALGALAEYGFIYPVEKIVLHIVQPRISNIDRWETTVEEITAWGGWVKERAELAYKGEGEFHEGTWCDSCFCKIAGTCRHRAEKHLQLMETAMGKDNLVTDYSTLSDEEIGAILKKAQFLASWVKKLESYAQNRLLEGGQIPGWKLVEGRSNRTFTDTEAAFGAIVEAGYDRALLYEEKPITLVKRRQIEGIRMIYGNVPDTLSQLIRTAFVPGDGCHFCVADFSAIEARVLAWMAGEQWRLDVFRTHGKIYEASASAMFGVPIETIAKGRENYKLRQKGKVAELALGYGGGAGALIAMGALNMGLMEEWKNL